MAILGISLLLISTISYVVYRSSPRIPSRDWYPQFFQKHLNHPPHHGESTDSPKVPEFHIIGDEDDEEDSDGEKTLVATDVAERINLDWDERKQSQDGGIVSTRLPTHSENGPSLFFADPKPRISIQAPSNAIAGIPGQKALSSSQPSQPPPRNPSSTSSPSSLMPPPPRPSKQNSTLKPPPSPASLLRTPPSLTTTTASTFTSSNPTRRLAIPTTTPSNSPSLLPPPTTSTLAPTPRNPLPTTTTTNTNKSRSRRKPVILAPGHSTLDWARLERSGADLRGPIANSSPDLIPVSTSLLRQHNKRSDAWTCLGGRVYNITPYLPFHPGGEAELMRAAGRDGTNLMMEIHPWVSWESMLRACLVGMMVVDGDDDSRVGGREKGGRKGGFVIGTAAVPVAAQTAEGQATSGGGRNDRTAADKVTNGGVGGEGGTPGGSDGRVRIRSDKDGSIVIDGVKWEEMD